MEGFVMQVVSIIKKTYWLGSNEKCGYTNHFYPGNLVDDKIITWNTDWKKMDIVGKGEISKSWFWDLGKVTLVFIPGSED